MKYSVSGARIMPSDNETLVAGAMGVHFAEFDFDDSWNEYTTKKAVFKNGDTTVETLIVNGMCEVPWEVLTESGTLLVGVYGENSDMRRPTLWASPKTVNEGAAEGTEAREPTPDTWQQLLGSIEHFIPHISADGIWCVGDMYTGVPATGMQGEKGDKGNKGDTGANGKDGYTPKRGIDYYTDADKSEIVTTVLAALPNGDEVSY